MPAIAPPHPAHKRLSRSGHRLPVSKESLHPRSLAANDANLSRRQDVRDRRRVAPRFRSDALFVLLTRLRPGHFGQTVGAVNHRRVIRMVAWRHADAGALPLRAERLAQSINR